MAYLVILTEKSSNDLETALLDAHINHLKQMTASGNLVICGPTTDTKAAILVFQADNMDEVINLVQSDPFIQNGYYQRYTIQEFIEANFKNNWLA